MFFVFGLAGFIVSIIAGFALGLIAALFNLIPGIGEPVAIILYFGKKIVGGGLALGFGAVACEFKTISGGF